MNPIIIQKYKSYYIGSLFKLNKNNLEKLVNIFEQPNVEIDSVLEGRGSIRKTDLEGFGPVVIKYNIRGGFVRHFVERTYVRFGKVCNRVEFEQLINASRLSVNVPEPIAYATKGSLFYKGWLVLKEIKNSETLVAVSLKDGDRTRNLLKEMTRQIIILINSRMYHVDLHPGNILVTDDDRIFIIDFHRAYTFKGSKNKLMKKYLVRWKRAIKKHKLPKILNEILEKKFHENI